jgi:signal transduction histidine kinase
MVVSVDDARSSLERMRRRRLRSTVRRVDAVNVLSRRSRPTDWRMVDVIVASVLVCVSVFVEASRHAGAVELVAVAAGAATVAWRRRAPASACLVALVGDLIVYRHTGASGEAADLGIPQLALALDYYLLGCRSAERGWETPSLLLLAAAVPVACIGVGLSDVFTVIVRVALVVALPFVVGRAIATRSAMTADNKRLEREQREHARRAAGEERTRVARELHDIVAHSVSVMVIHAVAARDVADQNVDVAREALGTVQDCGCEALSEMRRMIGVLRRGELESIGGSAPGLSLLGALVDRARASALEVELRVEGEPRRLSPGVDLTAFRVVQEALTNTIKHAGPTRTTVVVTYSDRALELEITDAGRVPGRAHESSAPGGNGLAGMRERVTLYGGELRTGTDHRGGFRVSARIPLDEIAAQRDAGLGKRSRIRHGQQRRWFDPALAAVLLAVSETELFLVLHRGPLLRDALLLAGLAVPIAWRRRAPLGVACAVMIVLIGCSVGTNSVLNVVQSPIFDGLILPYTVAAYASSRARAWVGLGVCLAGPELAVLIAGGGVGSSEIAIGLCAASWVTGRALRAHRERAEELSRTAERIASEREDRERLAVVDERTRIARELQAAVARSVSTMVVQSHAAERLLDTHRAQADDAMAAIERTGREALDEMRRILGVLREADHKAELAPQPGVGQLYALIEDARANGRRVELHVEGDPRPLPASVDLGVYRILHEALASTRDTADLPAPIAVSISFGANDVALDVTARWPAPVSWPTVAMRERVALCGGDVTLDKIDGASERLRVRMPGALEGALAT